VLNRLRLGLLLFAVVFAASGQNTFWSTAAVPKIASVSNDSSPVTLGLPFYSSVPGTVLGLRFYKGSRNTGTHVGALYSAAGGEALAKANFVGESGKGWQTVLFPVPVHIADHATYTVAYLAPKGGYADDQNFTWSALNSPPLHVVGPGGVFAYGASLQFPTGVYNRSNYWVDVIFRQDPPTGPHSVTLRWTPCTKVTIAEYRILRGATAGGPYTQIASMPTGSSYTDRTVENGKTYYYVITAVDDKGAEVTRAKEFKGVIPH
jgi:hypothetical protein